MNKILVSQEEITIENTSGWMTYQTNPISIIVKGNVTLYELALEKEDRDITITVCEDANLNYIRFSKITQESKVHFRIISKNHSTTNFWLGVHTTAKYEVTINNTLEENEASSYIQTKAVTEEKGTIEVHADGYIGQATKDNKFTESLHILNLGEEMATVLPDLRVDSEEVEANHFTTISQLDEESLFYLQTKGLSAEKAQKLIKDGFILSIYQNDAEMLAEVQKNLK